MVFVIMKVKLSQTQALRPESASCKLANGFHKNELIRIRQAHSTTDLSKR
jgi:hypothetical protein